MDISTAWPKSEYMSMPKHQIIINKSCSLMILYSLVVTVSTFRSVYSSRI